MTVRTRGIEWYDLFNRYAEDLYPGRYTKSYCYYLSSLGYEIAHWAKEKNSTILAHNYLYPEFHELADRVGDSLDLSMYSKRINAPRVDFQSVYFMGATAKIICGDDTRVFVPDKPHVIGCSLVFGTDYTWIENWKREHPDGILVTYINSDAYIKSISDYISTSRNCDAVIVHAARQHPRAQILVLPDRYLGYVMKSKAVAQGVDPKRIEVYEFFKDTHRACCYVHEKIQPSDAVDLAFQEIADNPEVGMLIHPECGCAASCQLRIERDNIPNTQAYIASTNLMIQHARESAAKKFLVATEIGMVYRLRKELPEKTFVPVSYDAECRFMKECTFTKLLNSLTHNRYEVVLCDDCCDPKNPYQDDRVIHIQRSIAQKAKVPIERMMSIQ